MFGTVSYTHLDVYKRQVCRELVLVKVRCNAKDRQAVISIADIFRAKIVDVSQESLIVEMTGAQSKLDAFIQLLDG